MELFGPPLLPAPARKFSFSLPTSYMHYYSPLSNASSFTHHSLADRLGVLLGLGRFPWTAKSSLHHSTWHQSPNASPSRFVPFSRVAGFLFSKLNPAHYRRPSPADPFLSFRDIEAASSPRQFLFRCSRSSSTSAFPHMVPLPHDGLRQRQPTARLFLFSLKLAPKPLGASPFAEAPIVIAEPPAQAKLEQLRTNSTSNQQRHHFH